MLTGTALGAAIEQARVLKGVTKKEMAEHFGVRPPSIQDWVKRGTIDKARLPALWSYFSDVVQPAHWGLDDRAAWEHPSSTQAPLAAALGLDEALERVGIAIAAMPPDRRQELADDLRQWAMYGGREAHRVAVAETLTKAARPADRTKRLGT